MVRLCARSQPLQVARSIVDALSRPSAIGTHLDVPALIFMLLPCEVPCGTITFVDVYLFLSLYHPLECVGYSWWELKLSHQLLPLSSMVLVIKHLIREQVNELVSYDLCFEHLSVL